MKRSDSNALRQHFLKGARGDGLMTVAQLACATEATAHKVRYYARIGLVEPATVGINGYRLFDKAMIGRLRFIRRAQRLGFHWMRSPDLCDTPSAATVLVHRCETFWPRGCHRSGCSWQRSPSFTKGSIKPHDVGTDTPTLPQAGTRYAD
jgi:hypothetical protein